jgi:hypothetical protein
MTGQATRDAAIVVWCVTAIIGAFAARRGYRKWRG